jgi:hypothetical protein
MSYEVTINKEENFLHVQAAGERTLDNILAITHEIMAAYARHGIPKVLVDVREIEGALSTMEGFELPTEHFQKIRDQRILQKAAIVDRKENEERFRFFQTVAENRGFNLRVFTDVDEATSWL